MFTECKDFSDMELVGVQFTVQNQYCTVKLTSNLNSQVAMFRLCIMETHMYEQTDGQGSSLHICA